MPPGPPSPRPASGSSCGTTAAALLGVGALPLAAVMPSLPMALYAGSALASTGHIMAMNGLDKPMWDGHLPIGTNDPFVWLVGSGVFGIAFLFSVLPLRSAVEADYRAASVLESGLDGPAWSGAA